MQMFVEPGEPDTHTHTLYDRFVHTLESFFSHFSICVEKQYPNVKRKIISTLCLFFVFVFLGSFHSCFAYFFWVKNTFRKNFSFCLPYRRAFIISLFYAKLFSHFSKSKRCQTKEFIRILYHRPPATLQLDWIPFPFTYASTSSDPVFAYLQVWQPKLYVLGPGIREKCLWKTW